MRHSAWICSTAAALLLGGCGSSGQGASTPGTLASGKQPDQATSARPEEDDDPPSPEDLQGVPAEHLPPGEGGRIPLQVLLPVPDPAPPSGFPTPSTTDKECSKTVGLVGQLDKDFAALTSSCGTGAGLKEYTKAVSGKLDAGNKRDEFDLKLFGGYCYRLFAVADGTIQKLGIRIHRDNGALRAAVMSKQPVAIYKQNETWCRRRDRDYRIVVEVLEGGEGRYAFGVWAKPNEKGRSQKK